MFFGSKRENCFFEIKDASSVISIKKVLKEKYGIQPTQTGSSSQVSLELLAFEEGKPDLC